jgi:two-component system, NarL family, sensor histidine kinase DegS
LAHHEIKDRIVKTLRNPGFWLLLAVMALITIPYYRESLPHPSFITRLTADLGLTRHAFERILYLAPIVWAGFMFGWRGAFYISLAALACMLPQVIFMSDSPGSSLLETASVFVLGNVISISFAFLRREREYRKQLEVTQQDLKVSEERYRSLFENAIDGIWIHDLEGNFTSFNRASEKIIGYSRDEIFKMNAKDFLSQESLDLAHQIRRKLLKNEPVEQPYEQRVFRRDGSEIYIQLSTSVVMDKGKPVGFQNIARDISEQKRMNENLHFYLQQATRAQEEERKRISHELHDDTIQSLVALSRQLDALASGDKGLSDEVHQRLEELWKQTDSILQGVRRLSQDLRPAAIDRLGLLPAIQWLASEVSKYSGIETKVDVIGKEHRLPEEGAIALFRITQEALRNVWRHSGATTAEITIEFSDKSTRITVKDNGKGFVLAGKVGDLAKEGKLGLAGMQERAQLVGGMIGVQSETGKGTTITVEAPG